jgi:hypothetical protein
MSVTPGSATVKAGQSATYTLTLTPVYGFKQTVSLSCGSLPQGASCAFTPATVTLDGTDTATAAVTVSTAAASMLSPGGKWPERPPFVLSSGKILLELLLLLGLVTILVAACTKRKEWLLAGLLLLAISWAGCNVSTQNVGTLAGTYTFSLTGSYTANGTLQHSLPVGLTVN